MTPPEIDRLAAQEALRAGDYLFHSDPDAAPSRLEAERDERGGR